MSIFQDYITQLKESNSNLIATEKQYLNTIKGFLYTALIDYEGGYFFDQRPENIDALVDVDLNQVLTTLQEDLILQREGWDTLLSQVEAEESSLDGDDEAFQFRTELAMLLAEMQYGRKRFLSDLEQLRVELEIIPTRPPELDEALVRVEEGIAQTSDALAWNETNTQTNQNKLESLTASNPVSQVAFKLTGRYQTLNIVEASYADALERQAQLNVKLYQGKYLSGDENFSGTVADTLMPEIQQQIDDADSTIGIVSAEIEGLEANFQAELEAVEPLEKIRVQEQVFTQVQYLQTSRLQRRRRAESMLSANQNALQSTPESDAAIAGIQAAVVFSNTRLSAGGATASGLMTGISNAQVTIGQTPRDLTGISLVTNSQDLSVWNDNIPCLLLPVKLETRFVKIKHVSRTGSSQNFDGSTEVGLNSKADRKELWIRIYPDDVFIKTHEPDLTDDEIVSGQQFWISVWEDGNDLEEKKGAWRALVDGYGPERSAWIIRQTKPLNLETDGSLLAEPTFPTLTPKEASWTQAAYTDLLPDRFVARLYRGDSFRQILGSPIPENLTVGPPPMDENSDAFDDYREGLIIPEEIAWLTDFEEAEKKGMAIRVPLLGAEISEGFDKLLVLGAKASKTESETQLLVEAMIDDHHFTTGLGILKQGTPTNNTQEAKSGWVSYEKDGAESFDIEVGGPLIGADATNPTDGNTTDGEALANALGINHEKLHHIRNADGIDMAEAKAMNKALWPSTMGYYLDNMLAPLVSDQDMDEVRQFYEDNVMARGHLPAFRVDNQPYGMLLTSDWDRWDFTASENQQMSAKLFRNVLKHLDTIWEELSDKLQHVGSDDPSQKILSELLSMHASSVSLYQRFSLSNTFFAALSMYQQVQQMAESGTRADGFETWFKQAGFNLATNPKLFDLVYLDGTRPLEGPIADEGIASEINAVNNLTNASINYIEWLEERLTSANGIEGIRVENFGSAGSPATMPSPRAMLYLMLRHSILLEYLNTAIVVANNGSRPSRENLVANELVNTNSTTGISAIRANILNTVTHAEAVSQRALGATNAQVLADANTLFTARANNFQQAPNTRFNLLQDTSATTGTLTVGDYIQDQLVNNPNGTVAQRMASIREALGVLKHSPTARLERCFMEHLDTMSFRLDAWMQGLAYERLQKQRAQNPNGLYLGAFGWLEGVKPKGSWGIGVKEVNPGDAVDGGAEAADGTVTYTGFTYLGSDPETRLEIDTMTGAVIPAPVIDDNNQGFIHAPSIQHATTAAILRNGFLTYKDTGGNSDVLAVDLSSERVRKALFYIDGLNNGQELGALLGYQFERKIREEAGQITAARVNEIILIGREKYSLVAGNIVGIVNTDIKDQEANNVLNGLALMQEYKSAANKPSFLGIFTEDADEKSDLTLIIEGLINDVDAIADLLTAESVYQLSQGNLDRAGATLRGLSGESTYIQEPEIIRTPRRGEPISHKVAVVLPQAPNSWPGPETPRAVAEPRLNAWLTEMLPQPEHICIHAQYEEEGNPDLQSIKLDISTLEIQPIDLLFLIRDHTEKDSASDLGRQIAYYLYEHHQAREDQEIIFDLASREGFDSTDFSIFELSALIDPLRKLVGGTRFLEPLDTILPSDGLALNAVYNHLELQDRLEAVLNGQNSQGVHSLQGQHLAQVLDDLQTAVANAQDLDADLIGTTDTGGTIIGEADLATLRNVLKQASSLGVSGSMPESARGTDTGIWARLIEQGEFATTVLLKRQTDATTLLTNLPSDEQKKIESLVEVAKLLLGNDFRVFPSFNAQNPAEIDQGLSMQTQFLAHAGTMALHEWIQGVTKVSTDVARWDMAIGMAEYTSSFDTSERLKILQLPLNDNGDDSWLGVGLPENYTIPPEVLSIVAQLPENFQTSLPVSGFVIDEWTEMIPDPVVASALTMHYDQPNTTPPQTLLLAVTPKETGSWEWDDLMGVLDATLGMAKKRAVDPQLLKTNPLIQMLPAIIAEINGDGGTPSLDFAKNIVPVPPGSDGPVTVPPHQSSSQSPPNDNSN